MVGAVTAGTKLGHYECTTALHDSDLWLAKTDEGEHFVLRILTAEQVQDPKFSRMSDASGSGELHQASIAGIEHIGEEQGIHYLATEYVHGEALVQLLARVEERGKQISLQHVLAIAVSIAEAMHHAHELGIQCSLSPAQVLIGYDGVVKVDLGRVGAPPRPAYRSPEHAAGLATDRRSDVFVIGILLYECVTLNRLFDTKPGPIARPSTLRKGLPSEIEKIVMRALATEASDRYVNAGELRAALSQFASKAGMKLGSDSLSAYMKQMFEKRDLPWVAGGQPTHASRAFGRAGTRPVGDRAATAASPARKRKTPAAGSDTELDTTVLADRNFDTSDSTMEGRKFEADDVTNKLPPPGGTEDPTGKVAFLNGDNARTTSAKIPEKKKVTNGESAKATVKVAPVPKVTARPVAKPVVVVPSPDGKVAGKLVPIDPTEETKLPDPELADETVVSPPPIIEKPSPVKRPVVAKAPAKLPAPKVAKVVAAERAESEATESEELRIPTMIATPPPPPLVITATTVASGDSTAVVKPLPKPGTRARRPSTAKAAAAAPASETTDTDEIIAPGPSRKKILIGAAVAVAIAIPLAIVLWPNPVAEKVAQQAAQPVPPPERSGPIAAGPDPSERQAAEGLAEGSSEPTPTEPAPGEPATEPTPSEPAPPEPAPAEPPPAPTEKPTPGEPKPSVFVPREGSGSAEAPKPKPAPVKATPKPKPRVAVTKAKPGKKPVTKAPKGPTYDPDSLFLKKK